MKIISLVKEKAIQAKNKVTYGALAFAFVLAFGGATSTNAAPVDFTGTTLPFTVPDTLATAVNFLTLYGEWVLLALGVIFAPVLYGLAMRLVSAAKRQTATKS